MVGGERDNLEDWGLKILLHLIYCHLTPYPENWGKAELCAGACFDKRGKELSSVVLE